jgi:hypothetical protein
MFNLPPPLTFEYTPPPYKAEQFSNIQSEIISSVLLKSI